MTEKNGVQQTSLKRLVTPGLLAVMLCGAVFPFNSPSTMQVGKVDRRPHLTEYPVTDPAEQSQRPPESRHQTQLEHTWVFTPGVSL